MGNQQSREDRRRSICCVSKRQKEEPYGADDECDGNPSQTINQNTRRSQGLPTYSALHDTCDDYIMKRRCRGIFLIIDNRNIIGLPPRVGADEEVTQLKNVFQTLHFEVRHLRDLNKKQVISTMEKVSHEDHCRYDCFGMAVLTHGDEGDILKASDGGYYTYQLYEKFNGKTCTSLQGKPKIFIFNACKGREEDQVDSVCTRSRVAGLGTSKESSKGLDVPLLSKTEDVVTGHVYSDFLCAFSTWQGYKSYRHPTGGSLYIRYLCEELIKGCKNGKDLTLILARVSRRLAESPPVDGKRILRQTSYYISSLTKRVVLPV